MNNSFSSILLSRKIHLLVIIKKTKKDFLKCIWKVSKSFERKKKQHYGRDWYKILAKHESKGWLSTWKIIIKCEKTFHNNFLKYFENLCLIFFTCENFYIFLDIKIAFLEKYKKFFLLKKSIFSEIYLYIYIIYIYIIYIYIYIYIYIIYIHIYI